MCSFGCTEPNTRPTGFCDCTVDVVGVLIGVMVAHLHERDHAGSGSIAALCTDCFVFVSNLDVIGAVDARAHCGPVFVVMQKN